MRYIVNLDQSTAITVDAEEAVVLPDGYLEFRNTDKTVAIFKVWVAYRVVPIAREGAE